MATIKRMFVFATCILSGIGVLFTIIALSTEQWVVSDSTLWVDENYITPENTIKYGLFKGSHERMMPYAFLQITMTCLMKENVCALLCAANSDDRYELLRNLYNGVTVPQDEANCPTMHSLRYHSLSFSASERNEDNKKFINCGVWVSTIFFLVVSLVFGLVSSALSMYNTVSNPVEVYLSILCLYFSNGIALSCSLLAMTLWGVMHIIITQHNIGIFYTLTGDMTSDKRAELGFSYWINIIPVVFYTASIVVLYLREYLLSKDPVQKMVEREETADPVIYLY